MKTSTKRKRTVELRRGVVRWYYVILAGNGQVVQTSEKYFSKSNARRAAVATSDVTNSYYKERN